MTESTIIQKAIIACSAIRGLMRELQDNGYTEDSEEILTLSGALGVSNIWR